MALWAGLVALIVTFLAILTGRIDVAVLLRSVLELGAVLGVFALVCAAEANS
jgi:hypothetical protein